MTEHETMPAHEPVPGFSLDPKLVKNFAADRLDKHGQAELADQVSHLIAFHAELVLVENSFTGFDLVICGDP